MIFDIVRCCSSQFQMADSQVVPVHNDDDDDDTKTNNIVASTTSRRVNTLNAQAAYQWNRCFAGRSREDDVRSQS